MSKTVRVITKLHKYNNKLKRVVRVLKKYQVHD